MQLTQKASGHDWTCFGTHKRSSRCRSTESLTNVNSRPSKAVPDKTVLEDTVSSNLTDIRRNRGPEQCSTIHANPCAVSGLLEFSCVHSIRTSILGSPRAYVKILHVGKESPGSWDLASSALCEQLEEEGILSVSLLHPLRC